MNKFFYEKDESCKDCHHFGFCQIYWGAACKRQGGRRIPRLKTGIKPVKNLKGKGIEAPHYKELFAQISTKRVDWQL